MDHAAATPNTVFDATGTPFQNLALSKLEIVPPATLAGRVILDNLSISQSVEVLPAPVVAQIDLKTLVDFGEDGGFAGGAFGLKTFAAQDFGTVKS